MLEQTPNWCSPVASVEGVRVLIGRGRGIHHSLPFLLGSCSTLASSATRFEGLIVFLTRCTPERSLRFVFRHLEIENLQLFETCELDAQLSRAR